MRVLNVMIAGLRNLW